jgi:hypothetical protein
MAFASRVSLVSSLNISQFGPRAEGKATPLVI